MDYLFSDQVTTHDLGTLKVEFYSNLLLVSQLHRSSNDFVVHGV